MGKMEEFKISPHKSQTERYADILGEASRKMEEITFSRSEEAKVGEREESEEIFREKSRELWKDFVVHGVLRFDPKEKKIKLLPFSDLDGKACLGLFKLAGFDVSQVTYVRPGDFKSGAINLDTGNKTGIEIEDKTAWFDHHGEDADRASMCGARWVHLGLLAKGFLKKDAALEKLVQFVSRVDREKYPDSETLFYQSDKTVLGLEKFFSFENLYDYFKQGRSPEEVLSAADLKKYGLEEQSKRQKGLIESSKKAIKELEQEGFVIGTKFGKVVVDVGGKLAGGYRAARAAGYDGYVLYNPRLESFFISIKDADLSKLELIQGVNVRKNMWIKLQDEKDSLQVPLRKILEKLEGRIPQAGKLKDTIEALDLRFKDYVVLPKLSRDKEGQIKVITWDLGKLAIFPKNFHYQPGKKYRVRIKSDSAPGERKGFYILEVL